MARWYLRTTTFYDEEQDALSDPEEWEYVGDYHTLSEVLQALGGECPHPICLTDASNPYGGAFVDWYQLNRYLGLPETDSSRPADEKYDALDDDAKANLLVYSLAHESVLAPEVIQSANARYRAK